MKETTPASIAETYAHQVWNEKNLKAIDELVYEDVLIHSLLGDFRGSDAMKNVVQTWLQGFPDLNVTNHHVICENDMVSIQWRAQGTHLGEFKGKKPTQRVIRYEGVTVYRVKNGKIIEYWAYLDMQHLLNQI